MMSKSDLELIRAFIECDSKDFTPHRPELVDDALEIIKKAIPEDNKKDIVITSSTNMGFSLRELTICADSFGVKEKIIFELCPCGRIEHYVHINEEE